MGESMEKVGKKTDRIKMDVILAAGCLLRLFYVLFSTIYDRQYDIGMIDLDAGHTVTGGHLAYIQYLYENWKLPDFDPTSVYQFNHPPLHHYLCALWMKLCSLFISNTDVLEESIQIVPFVCSLLILWFLLRIAEQFELTEKAKRFVLLLFCFHPALVLLSGSVNNDCMSLMFTVMCVYYTILWSQNRCNCNRLNDDKPDRYSCRLRNACISKSASGPYRREYRFCHYPPAPHASRHPDEPGGNEK